MALRLWLFVLLVYQVNITAACELSMEYKSARADVARIVYGDDNDYRRCQMAAENNHYWKALVKCIQLSGDDEVKSRCSHTVAVEKYKYVKFLSKNHCEIFKFDISSDTASQLLQDTLRERDIEKCKK